MRTPLRDLSYFRVCLPICTTALPARTDVVITQTQLLLLPQAGACCFCEPQFLAFTPPIHQLQRMLAKSEKIDGCTLYA